MRTVVVTGASRGLGRAIALGFAHDGARVVLVARSAGALETAAEAVRAAGGDPVVVVADITDPAAFDGLDEASDAVVAAAGIPGPTAPLWEVSPAGWEETVRANLTGVFLTCRAFLPAMVARGSGSIVVIGSMTGKRPLPGRTPYAAAKTGLIGLVRTLAWDAGPHGVRVNLVSPGPVAGNAWTASSVPRARARSRRSSPPRRWAASPRRTTWWARCSSCARTPRRRSPARTSTCRRGR
jgi:NAD(P)-dependent dehydrogenase (short-subunit alcohol dehydrogenase family)